MDSSSTLKPLTKSGEAWVKAYIHPPTPVTGVEGIPDFSTQSSAVVDFRNEFTITAPSDTGDSTWSALLISYPNPEYPLLVLKWVGELPAPTPGLGQSFSVYKNTGFPFETDAVNWDKAVARFRPVKFSGTHYFDASDLYNQGKVWQCQTAIDQYIPPRSQMSSPDPDRLKVVNNFGRLPVTGGDVMQASSKYVSGHAKDGAFQVLRFVNPAVQYEAGTTRAEWASVTYRRSDQTDVTGELDLNVEDGGTLSVPTYPGMSVGYALFKGLLKQATLSSKMIHSWEVVPDVGSIWTPFATPGPCPDIPALELGSVEMYKMLDGYPSAANDFGAFWNAAKSLGPVLKQVWGIAKPALKTGLSTLPAGGLLNQVLEGVESLALENTSNKKKKPKPQATPQPVAKVKPKKKKLKQS